MNLTEKQERLAKEIAHALDDMDSIQWHRKIVATYSEDHLRKKLQKALSTPQEKIYSSRAALYNWLLNQ